MADDELGLTWHLLTSIDDVMDDSITVFGAWLFHRRMEENLETGEACGGACKLGLGP